MYGAPVDTLLAGNIESLKQGRDLLRSVDERVYSNADALLFTHSVGSHFRHVLDFHTCFLTGLAGGRVDYDTRERDELVATDRLYAISRIEAVMETLENVPAIRGIDGLMVRLEGGDSMSWSRSSVERELQFLLSHTVHHYALIAMMLRLQGFFPSEEFGVAPSTLAHWKRG